MTSSSEAMRNIVLVVDDSAPTIAMLADTLETAGMTALVALRGDRAISVAKQITPDIILMDAMMPGMDGFETCRQIKSDDALAHIPIIFMTGLADTDHIVKGLEVGGVDYITKPVEPKELLARMRVHLSNARTTFSAQSALDSTGRYLLALDGDGALVWWTPQAGRLISSVLTDGLHVGAVLPESVRVLIERSHQEASGLNTIELTKSTHGFSSSLQMSYVGRLGQGEFLMRVFEDSTSETESILCEKLQISSREAQVLAWISQGKSNRDIADILDLSPRTINKHLERIFKKIGAENRTTAALIALKHL